MSNDSSDMLFSTLNPSLSPLPPPTHTAAEEALKARREIADYIKNKRTERARIRVSQPASWNYDVVGCGTWSCDTSCDNLASTA